MALATCLLSVGCVYHVAGPNMKKMTECPKHGASFEVFRVSTTYGLVRDSASYREARDRDFPYAATFSRRGCIVGPFSWLNRHDHVFACPVCTAAWKEYEAAHSEGRGATSNTRLSPTVRPVTTVAFATVAPGRPAGYAQRYAVNRRGDR